MSRKLERIPDISRAAAAGWTYSSTPLRLLCNRFSSCLSLLRAFCFVRLLFLLLLLFDAWKP